MYRIILSYCKSHIYELHALLSATIAFLLMFPVKKMIKKAIGAYVEKKALENSQWKRNRRLIQKRLNISVLVAAVLLSMSLFFIVSLISPLIEFSWFTALLSGAFSLTEYAVFDQLCGTEGRAQR